MVVMNWCLMKKENLYNHKANQNSHNKYNKDKQMLENKDDL